MHLPMLKKEEATPKPEHFGGKLPLRSPLDETLIAIITSSYQITWAAIHILALSSVTLFWCAGRRSSTVVDGDPPCEGIHISPAL